MVAAFVKGDESANGLLNRLFDVKSTLGHFDKATIGGFQVLYCAYRDDRGPRVNVYHVNGIDVDDSSRDMAPMAFVGFIMGLMAARDTMSYRAR